LGASHQLHGSAQLDYHVSRVREWSPDVLCLQEAHEYVDGSKGQAETLAEAVGYKDVHTVAISPSHLAPGAELSLSVLSNFKIANPRYTQFPNPGLSNVGPNGEQWILFDKGYLTADLIGDEVSLTLVNAHCFPLHYFGVTAADAQFSPMWADFAEDLLNIAANGPVIAVIDLNYEPIEALLGELFSHGRYTNAFSRTPTIPKGIQQDYIIYTESRLRLEETSVTPTKADHHYCQARLAF
jgi:endonuclease/exonuclease/phosphatase family metal-dependent hydrolase